MAPVIPQVAFTPLLLGVFAFVLGCMVGEIVVAWVAIRRRSRELASREAAFLAREVKR